MPCFFFETFGLERFAVAKTDHGIVYGTSCATQLNVESRYELTDTATCQAVVTTPKLMSLENSASSWLKVEPLHRQNCGDSAIYSFL